LSFENKIGTNIDGNEISWYEYSGMNILVWISWYEYVGMNILEWILWYEYSGMNILVWISWYEYPAMNILVWIFWYEYSGMNILVWISWYEFSNCVLGQSFGAPILTYELQLRPHQLELEFWIFSNNGYHEYFSLL